MVMRLFLTVMRYCIVVSQNAQSVMTTWISPPGFHSVQSYHKVTLLRLGGRIPRFTHKVNHPFVGMRWVSLSLPARASPVGDAQSQSLGDPRYPAYSAQVLGTSGSVGGRAR